MDKCTKMTGNSVVFKNVTIAKVQERLAGCSRLKEMANKLMLNRTCGLGSGSAGTTGKSGPGLCLSSPLFSKFEIISKYEVK